MKCTAMRFGDGGIAIVCTGRRRAAKCFYCPAEHQRLCDFAVAPGKTCNRKLCLKHTAAAGPDLDLCCDHANATQVGLGATELVVFTGNVHRHRRDPDAFDITLASGGIDGAPFAPSVSLFRPAKAMWKRAAGLRLEVVEIEHEARAALPADDLVDADDLAAYKAAMAPSEGLIAEATRIEDETWAIFRRGYCAEMLISAGRPTPPGWERDVADARIRGVVPHREAWTKLLRRRRVVLLCYEADRIRCHRGLLAEILIRLGATDGGEIVGNPDQLPLFEPESRDP